MRVECLGGMLNIDGQKQYIFFVALYAKNSYTIFWKSLSLNFLHKNKLWQTKLMIIVTYALVTYNKNELA